MNTPKEDGYYWYKPEDSDLTVVEACDANTEFARFYCVSYEDCFTTGELTGKFISKITPPDIND